MAGRNAKVDALIAGAGRWREEMARLREIALASGLDEVMKWGQPCYALDGKNVFLLHGFKDYCAILFMKGALMKDEAGLLVQQTENVQSARQIRFSSLQSIEQAAGVVEAAMREAIEIERAGLKLDKAARPPAPLPAELQARLDASPKLKAAFAALTPGRRRAYGLHVGGAKRAETRAARVKACEPMILAGRGIDDPA